MIRLVCLLAPRSGLDRSEFFERLRDEVGPLVAGMQAKLGLARYVQLHSSADSDETDGAARTARKMDEPVHHAMVDYWWKSPEQLSALADSAEGCELFTRIAAAQAELIDPEHSCCWLAHEYPQVSTVAGRVLAEPRTSLMRLVFPLRALPRLGEEAARRYWLTMHGPLVRSHSRARGLAAYQQVHRWDSPLVAKLAETLGLRIGEYLGHAEAWFDRAQPRQGPEVEAAAGNALADEHQFIDLPNSTLFSGKEYPFVLREWTL